MEENKEIEKKVIEVAVNYKTVTTEKKNVNLPTTKKFYERNDDGVFFPRGLILFAIIPKHENSTDTYLLVEVERGKQDYNDFVPTKDCRQDYWLSDKGSKIRHTALEIFTNDFHLFKEITEKEFEEKRIKLLDVYK